MHGSVRALMALSLRHILRHDRTCLRHLPSAAVWPVALDIQSSDHQAEIRGLVHPLPNPPPTHPHPEPIPPPPPPITRPPTPSFIHCRTYHQPTTTTTTTIMFMSDRYITVHAMEEAAEFSMLPMLLEAPKAPASFACNRFAMFCPSDHYHDGPQFVLDASAAPSSRGSVTVATALTLSVCFISTVLLVVDWKHNCVPLLAHTTSLVDGLVAT